MIPSFIRIPAAATMLLLATGEFSALVAQDSGPAGAITVSGRVINQTSGVGLPGAMVQGYPSGPRAVTDSRGTFELRLRPGEYVLVASLLGYGDQRHAVAVTPGATEPLVFRLNPEPILLEGIRVISNQFESRRHSIPMSSRVVERDRLTRAAGENAWEFLLTWGGITPTQCPRGARSLGQSCVYRRGQEIVPTVYIDDRVAMGGVDALTAFTAGQLHHVEVYGRGMMIRIYTLEYVEAVARGQRRLPAALF